MGLHLRMWSTELRFNKLTAATPFETLANMGSVRRILNEEFAVENVKFTYKMNVNTVYTLPLLGGNSRYPCNGFNN